MLTSGDATCSSLSMNLYLWLSYDHHYERTDEEECALALLLHLSIPSTAVRPAYLDFTLHLLECLLPNYERGPYPTHLAPDRESLGAEGCLPPTTDIDAERVRRALKHITQTCKDTDLAASTRFTAFMLLLSLGKWCHRARQLRKLPLSPAEQAIVYWLSGHLPDLNQVRKRSFDHGRGAAFLTQADWWLHEAEWTLLSAFYPTIGGTHIHGWNSSEDNAVLFKAIMLQSGMEMEEFVRRFALDPDEIKNPSPNSLLKLITVTKLIQEAHIPSTPTLLSVVCSALSGADGTEHAALSIAPTLYGQLVLAIWRTLDRQDRSESISLASLDILTRYLRALCDSSTEHMAWVDVPVTSNPYSAVLRESKDVIRCKIDPVWAVHFVDLAFKSKLRSSAREVGLHHACEALIQKVPNLHKGWVVDARESYRNVDQELPGKDFSLVGTESPDEDQDRGAQMLGGIGSGPEMETRRIGRGDVNNTVAETNPTEALGTAETDAAEQQNTIKSRPNNRSVGDEGATVESPIEDERGEWTKLRDGGLSIDDEGERDSSGTDDGLGKADDEVSTHHSSRIVVEVHLSSWLGIHCNTGEHVWLIDTVQVGSQMWATLVSWEVDGDLLTTLIIGTLVGSPYHRASTGLSM